MSEIMNFIRERVAEGRRAAEGQADGVSTVMPSGILIPASNGITIAQHSGADVAITLRRDPKEILAQCEALDALATLHSPVEELGQVMCGHCAFPGQISGDLEGDFPCKTISGLAAIWRWHGDWQEQWQS